MSRTITLNIPLTPVVQYDALTKTYIIYYEEFPIAVATGATKDDAEKNLNFLVEDVWAKRPTETKAFLLENYKDRIELKTTANC